MSEIAIATQRVEAAPFSPVEAMGRLRAYTPGRGHFLLEAIRPDGGENRFSIVGYRVRSGEMVPPWSNWLDVFGDTEALAEAEGTSEVERLAAGVARAFVGAFTQTFPMQQMDIPAPKDAGASLIMAGATVLVFDHDDGSMTAAGPAKGNLVPRILYELEHGQTPPELAASSADAPIAWSAVPDADKLMARCTRTADLLDEDDLPRLVLARTWNMPLGKVDPFDIYRAWREQTDAPMGYFIDFGETPMQGAVCVLGVGDTVLHQRRPGIEGPSWKDALGAALPHPSCTGTRDPLGLRVIARVEDQSRELYGGAVGYIAPGGVATALLAQQSMQIIGGLCTLSGGVELELDADPADAIAASDKRAAHALTAVASAQG